MITAKIGDYIRITVGWCTYTAEGTVKGISSQGLFLEIAPDQMLYFCADFFDEHIKIDVIRPSTVAVTVTEVKIRQKLYNKGWDMAEI